MRLKMEVVGIAISSYSIVIVTSTRITVLDPKTDIKPVLSATHLIKVGIGLTAKVGINWPSLVDLESNQEIMMMIPVINRSETDPEMYKKRDVQEAVVARNYYLKYGVAYRNNPSRDKYLRDHSLITRLLVENGDMSESELTEILGGRSSLGIMIDLCMVYKSSTGLVGLGDMSETQ